jgi:hypothetical protein
MKNQAGTSEKKRFLPENRAFVSDIRTAKRHPRRKDRRIPFRFFRIYTLIASLFG